MKTKIFITVLAVFMAASDFLNAQNEKASSVVSTYFAAVDAGDVQKVEAVCSAGFMAAAPFLPQPVPLSAWKGVGSGFKAGFPDMQHQIVDWFSDGRKVAVRGIFKGTNTGAMQGNPPTGNKVALPFTSIFELDKELKITALYIQFDQTIFQQQLMAGINPAAATETSIRSYFAALDVADAAAIAGFCTPAMVQYFPGEPRPMGLSDLQTRAAGFKAAFPDVKRGIGEIIVSGNKVTVRGQLTGTNTGSFMGKPATGKAISVPVLALFHLNAGGLIEEAYVEFDTKLADKQLGLDQMAKSKK